MRTHTVNGQQYRLPNELNPFQEEMYVHTINWKWENITQEPGYHTHLGVHIPYDAILPKEMADRQDWPHLYSTARDHLARHRQRNPFRIHPHFYHMVSSQAANINLFLPILHHASASEVLAGIQGAPKDFKTLATDQLDHGYCLEFWGGNFKDDQTDKGLLGDKSARAGTDSDIAIAYRNQQDELCLWLIEHKLVEPEFTTCGGLKSKGRTDKVRHDCTKSYSQILANKQTCYYHDKCRYKYWDITNANRSCFASPPKDAGCPFQGGMNQLWRNQLLAMAVQHDERQPFRRSSFSVVKHPRNHHLNGTLDDYRKLTDSNPDFSVFTSADVLAAVTACNDPTLNEWAEWYKQLYDV